ncbi:hypothetical protein B0920_03285 [Massilia sp. KIM]|uniref:transposase n=1 Tax=Massilia sp. KIM TaxID=1955422 RepID=UPI0009C88AB4|nr:hypothetical protein B0920_03285 [Massilia sp. KIM]
MPKGGRRRINDRATLTGILFVLKTKILWEYLPREPGCGSGMTCSRRLHECIKAGDWQRIHEAFFDNCASTTRSCGIELALTLPVYPPLRVASIGS